MFDVCFIMKTNDKGGIYLDKSGSTDVAEQYDRIAVRYDAMVGIIPNKWRRKTANLACGHVLEIGIGTGLNLPFYTDSCSEIIGIDLSSRMLAIAKTRGQTCKIPVALEVMDVQDLKFPSESFDTVIATFVFCTVPDALRGLLECGRVLKPGGKLILLEHVRSKGVGLGKLMDLLNPLALWLINDHINRQTENEVARAGLRLSSVENLLGDIVELIVATK